ncbi:MAG: DUF87 domain-containing protein [Christensenellaceae bacterium]
MHDVDRISLGNGTDDIHGLHSSVRSGLDESAPEVSENYVLTDDDFIHRTPKERFKDNVTAIKIVKELQLESRKATPDEQTKLAKYVGWGGLQDAFDENNSSWHSEYTELKTLLSDSEYKSAQETVLNAHFTPKEIIDGIYSGLRRLGVKQGKALEPSCGTGNFIGGVPEDVALKFDGVELDELTASIAKALYPNENIKQCGFEELKEKDGTYDVVIGNVPFGDYRVYDSDYNRHKFVIHDYFIAKSLDKLRSGGVMAVITGKGTLDKLSKTAREYFAQRAELLGAFRLPNTAFKSNAGTEAVADILFFRKRDENIAVTDLKDNGVDWLDSVTIDDGVAPLNEYFIKHPENVLGKFELVSGRFGQERTVAPTGDLKTQIEKAITTLSENIYNTSVEKEKPTQETQETNVISEEELDRLGVKKFSMFLSEDNRVFIRDIDGVSEIGIKKLQGVLEGKTLERVKGYLQIRDEVVKMLDTCITVTAYDYDKKGGEFFNEMRKQINKLGFRANPMACRQPEAYKMATLNSGLERKQVSFQGINSSSLAAAFPFVSNMIIESNGVQLGENAAPVIINFFKRDDMYKNSNVVVLGSVGGGKSFFAKTLFTNLMSDGVRLFILDPEAEYLHLAENCGGKVIDMGAGGNIINPFAVLTDVSDDNESAENLLLAHLTFLEEFFRTTLSGLGSENLELVLSLLPKLYARHNITPKTQLKSYKNDYPTFDDFYAFINELIKQTKSDEEREKLNTVQMFIAKFATGGRYSFLWNGQTNLQANADFIVFNFQTLLANSNKTIAAAQMLLLTQYLNNELIHNYNKIKVGQTVAPIVIAIDEAHVFIDPTNPVALRFMKNTAKRCRKYNGMQVVMTQSVNDFLGGAELERESKAVITESQYTFVFPLNASSAQDFLKLYDKLDITDEEANAIMDNARGSALFIAHQRNRTTFKVVTPNNIRRLFEEKVPDLKTQENLTV